MWYNLIPLNINYPYADICVLKKIILEMTVFFEITSNSYVLTS